MDTRLRAEYWISTTGNSGFVKLEKRKEKLMMAVGIVQWSTQYVLYFNIIFLVASQMDMGFPSLQSNADMLTLYGSEVMSIPFLIKHKVVSCYVVSHRLWHSCLLLMIKILPMLFYMKIYIKIKVNSAIFCLYFTPDLYTVGSCLPPALRFYLITCLVL